MSDLRAMGAALGAATAECEIARAQAQQPVNG
jgi:hypothetical protein